MNHPCDADSSSSPELSGQISPGRVLPGRVLVAICTYNEASNIEVMLSRLRVALPNADLLVVDDDSPDGTSHLASDWAQRDGRTEVVVRTGQRGLGGAIRRAIEIAVERSYDFFINLDADLSHDPDALPRLLACVAGSTDCDVAIGSRYVEGGCIKGWPLRRRMMSRMVNGFARKWLGLSVRDCSGSMRCYRVSVLMRLDLTGLRNNGYALLEELLVRLKHVDAKMVEMPICFTERQAGVSKLTMREAVTSAIAIVKLSRI